MAKSLKLQVIAEGVETEEQLRFLKEHDCDQFQGFYFSKPIPATDLAQILRRNPAATFEQKAALLAAGCVS
jgi:EAL domain-containing protein (putative c-di-GMP-specific phosphodiesterase class I)